VKIGEIAERSGVSRDTIRYYERIGLLARATRSASGYRVYSEGAVERIRLVRNAVRFGFSLSELATFLAARDKGSAPCRKVHAAGQRILEAVEHQLADLITTRDAMQAMLSEWHERLARTPPGSPARLLESLTPDAPAAPRRPLTRTRRRPA
jgi:DNA-binding transcriptional MerR regulator